MTPNILLVVFDTARADAFEPYGAPAGSSTTIAQLASSGLAHPATFSTACWTVPAHGSLFSGELPRSAGLGHVGGQDPPGFLAAMHELAPRLLPDVLRKAGYTSLGVSTNLWVSPSSGFDAGFDEFRYLGGRRNTDIGRRGIRGRARWVLEAVRARIDDGARAVEEVVATWLRDGDHRPFFCFVNLVECHSPYLPPKPWNDLNAWQRAQAALEAQRHLTFGEIWKGSVGGFDIPPAALTRMRRNYAASIRQLDDWLARVLGYLDDLKLLSDTQVIVTSDHGENLGDGSLIGHAFSLDDRLIRLPLVTSGPVDLRLPELLSIADVPRVLAQVAELDDHPWSDGPSGRPTVAQFDAPGVPGPKLQEALDIWGLGDDAGVRLCTSFSCATDGSLKLIRRLGREELIDLEADPLEEQPTSLDAKSEQRYGARLGPLRAALDDAEAQERPAVRAPASGDGIGAEDVEALEAQMRLLGYL